MAQCAIGIDVGGTKIAGAIVDLSNGLMTGTVVIPTEVGRGPEAVLADVADMSHDLAGTAQELGINVSGIGVCVPELVDLAGRVTSAQTLDWRQVDVGARLGFDGPTVVESDVRAGARAEARFGVEDRYPSFVYVSVGTGVSSTLVIDGSPWAGANGNAIVAASGVVPITCAHCGRSHALVPEKAASGAGIEATYAKATGEADISAREVIARATAGEETASAVVAEAATGLAAIIANLVNVLDPHAVVLGGGLGSAPGMYWDVLGNRLPDLIFGEQSRLTPVIRSSLGEKGPLLGAALTASRHV